MLQTGMRAPMGIKVFGPNLKAIEDFGLKLENILKELFKIKLMKVSSLCRLESVINLPEAMRIR